MSEHIILEIAAGSFIGCAVFHYIKGMVPFLLAALVATADNKWSPSYIFASVVLVLGWPVTRLVQVAREVNKSFIGHSK